MSSDQSQSQNTVQSTVVQDVISAFPTTFLTPEIQEQLVKLADVPCPKCGGELLANDQAKNGMCSKCFIKGE